MHYSLIFTLVAFVSLASCSSSKEAPQDDKAALEAAVYQVKPTGDSTQYLLIEHPCALLIYPKEQQADKLEKEMGEEAFMALYDKKTTAIGASMDLLDSLGIESKTTERPMIKLKGQTVQWFGLRNEFAPAWNVILFVPDKAPLFVDPEKLTEEQVSTYFSKN